MMGTIMRGLGVRILAAVFLLFVSACAGPTNEEFALMANAGKAFTTQIPSVYNFAYQRDIEASNAKIQQDHKDAMSIETASGRGPALESVKSAFPGNNRALIDRWDLYAQMIRQADLLNQYFTQVALLAGGAEADKTGKAASQLAKSLSAYVSELNSPIGNGKTVSQVFGSVTDLVVGQLSNKALREHLDAHNKAIRGAIKVQSAVLEQIQKDELDARVAVLNADLQAELGQARPLPADFFKQRSKILVRKPELNPISSALKASRELEMSFANLTAGGGGGVLELNRAIVITETLIDAFGG